MTIAKTFAHHTPTAEGLTKIRAVRRAFSDLLATVSTHCKPSRELSLAVTKLEEAAMWAIKGIVSNDPDSKVEDESGPTVSEHGGQDVPEHVTRRLAEAATPFAGTPTLPPRPNVHKIERKVVDGRPEYHVSFKNDPRTAFITDLDLTRHRAEFDTATTEAARSALLAFLAWEKINAAPAAAPSTFDGATPRTNTTAGYKPPVKDDKTPS